MAILLLTIAGALAAPVIPSETTQVVVGVASGWDSSEALVQRWSRTADGWEAVGEVAPARLGRSGLAWGLGLHPAVEGRAKVEGDWRAPAGVFSIGVAFSDGPAGPWAWPIRQVTERDLWVEDPASEHYNRHLVVPTDRTLTEWESGQRMRMGDPAHRLKLVVNHNAEPPTPGAGSAIFFHIWRGDALSTSPPTAGCTAMDATSLEALLGWLEPQASPVYVLLPEAEYRTYREAWGLP